MPFPSPILRVLMLLGLICVINTFVAAQHAVEETLDYGYASEGILCGHKFLEMKGLPDTKPRHSMAYQPD